MGGDDSIKDSDGDNDDFDSDQDNDNDEEEETNTEQRCSKSTEPKSGRNSKKEDKYGLDQTEEEIIPEPEVQPKQAGKQKLSKAARRKMKKGKQDNEWPESEDEKEAPIIEEEAEPEPVKTKVKGPAPKVRGQKGKKKKMQKYADQSDDDREIAMLALGHKKQIENEEKDIIIEKKKEDVNEEEVKCYYC